MMPESGYTFYTRIHKYLSMYVSLIFVTTGSEFLYRSLPEVQNKNPKLGPWLWTLCPQIYLVGSTLYPFSVFLTFFWSKIISWIASLLAWPTLYSLSGSLPISKLPPLTMCKIWNFRMVKSWTIGEHSWTLKNHETLV